MRGLMTLSLPIRIPKVKRIKTSVYFDPEVWTPFVKAVHNTGDSTCGVLEPYMFAYTMAVKKGVPVQAANLTLNLTVVREVRRERRRLRRGKEDVQVVEAGDPGKCSYCGLKPYFKISRWPDLRLCIEEFVCEGCFNDIMWRAKNVGYERIP